MRDEIPPVLVNVKVSLLKLMCSAVCCCLMQCLKALMNSAVLWMNLMSSKVSDGMVRVC